MSQTETATDQTDNPVFEWPWPDSPGARQIRIRQQELVGLLENRVPVFLDTNFWVMARQAAFEESDDPEVVSLLGALRLAVESGKVFFPLTSDLIAEFSKQPPELLAGTMLLVDRLSLGVVMVPHHERMALEVERFFSTIYPDVPPEGRPLWTTYAFALGYEDLEPPGIALSDSMRVAMAEKAWTMQPSVLSQNQSPDVFQAKTESERIAAYLNAQAALHAHEIDSHATAVRIEVAGSASMIQGVAAREYRRIALAKGELRDAADIQNSHAVGRKIAGMVAQALDQDRHRQALGSLYAPAMLHAAVRSRAGRKLSANDIFDFRHAAAALPYCRAFFTDGPLRSLIVSGHVKLDTLYGCRVISTPAEAIAVIKELVL